MGLGAIAILIHHLPISLPNRCGGISPDHEMCIQMPSPTRRVLKRGHRTHVYEKSAPDFELKLKLIRYTSLGKNSE